MKAIVLISLSTLISTGLVVIVTPPRTAIRLYIPASNDIAPERERGAP